jgi:hypothetical protein
MTKKLSEYERGVRDEHERILKHLEATKHWRYPNLQVQLLFEEMLNFMQEPVEQSQQELPNQDKLRNLHLATTAAYESGVKQGQRIGIELERQRMIKLIQGDKNE